VAGYRSPHKGGLDEKTGTHRISGGTIVDREKASNKKKRSFRREKESWPGREMVVRKKRADGLVGSRWAGA